MKILLILLISFSAMGREIPATISDFPIKLSQWKIFLFENNKFKLNNDVHIYQLRTSLFTDYSLKLRTMTLPENKKATWSGTKLVFPVGTILTKTFYYKPEEIGRFQTLTGPWGVNQYLMETRILFKSKKGWLASSYAWKGKEAFLLSNSNSVSMNYKDEEFEYLMPSQKDCLHCHTGPIGPKRADNLNLSELMAKKLIEEKNTAEIKPLPVWNKSETGTLKERTHAYLEVNCAHCHNPKGRAATTDLDYRMEASIDKKGHCMTSYSADENEYVIHSGKPQESEILVKLKSRDVINKMPEIGRDLVHKEAVTLVNDYIKSFKDNCD